MYLFISLYYFSVLFLCIISLYYFSVRYNAQNQPLIKKLSPPPLTIKMAFWLESCSQHLAATS